MCVDPNTLQLASGLTGAVAQLGGGTAAMVLQYQAANRAIKYNTQIIQRNREITRLKAEQARESGAQALSKHRQNVRNLISRQKTAYAASGVLVNAGTPFMVKEQARQFSALDEEIIRENIRREIFSYEQHMVSLSLQEDLLRKQKKQAGLQLGLGLGFNLIGSTAQGFQTLSAYGEQNQPAKRVYTAIP